MIVIQKQSGANSVNIAKKVHQKLPEIQKSLPSDVKLGVIMDTSTNILNTIDSLKETIFITFIIVMLVVFVFLGRWRATFYHYSDHSDLVDSLVRLLACIRQYTEYYLAEFTLYCYRYGCG